MVCRQWSETRLYNWGRCSTGYSLVNQWCRCTSCGPIACTVSAQWSCCQHPRSKQHSDTCLISVGHPGQHQRSWTWPAHAPGIVVHDLDDKLQGNVTLTMPVLLKKPRLLQRPYLSSYDYYWHLPNVTRFTSEKNKERLLKGKLSRYDAQNEISHFFIR